MAADTPAQVVPADDELTIAVTSIKAATPDLGIAKVLARVKSDNPSWSVSEKRLRKVLAQLQNGSTPAVATAAGNGESSRDLVAETGLDTTIDWSVAPKVKVKMFKDGKGKGLVAREKILEGEVIWGEDPWIATRSKQLYEYFTKGGMCTQCFNLFTSAPKFAVHCQHCGQATFCSRLCYGRREENASHLDLLCPGLNPACEALLKQIESTGDRELECAAKIVAKWRLSDAAEAGRIEERVWKGMARVHQVTKEQERKEWPMVGEQRMAALHQNHTLLLQALNPPESDKSANTKTFYKLLRKRKAATATGLTQEQESRWFSFDSFCELLGLASLNQEDSGGLYAMHAHMNHDCEPNVRARNLPRDYSVPDAPSDLASRQIEQRGTNRLTLVARRTIHPGEELSLPYVNYALPRSARREHLREVYGFWCHCNRCKREEGKPEQPLVHEHGHHEHGPGCHHD